MVWYHMTGLLFTLQLLHSWTLPSFIYINRMKQNPAKYSIFGMFIKRNVMCGHLLYLVNILNIFINETTVLFCLFDAETTRLSISCIFVNSCVLEKNHIQCYCIQYKIFLFDNLDCSQMHSYVFNNIFESCKLLILKQIW